MQGEKKDSFSDEDDEIIFYGSSDVTNNQMLDVPNQEEVLSQVLEVSVNEQEKIYENDEETTLSYHGMKWISFKLVKTLGLKNFVWPLKLTDFVLSLLK